ncbi:M16 family metallopeptidase [Kitasatospora sp. NPDC056138]|uniref:M16 family metallopeptidase n=1 Tax=Kitasatospora sp. NPDC056138 TaxID=3345724 RepID=UPI0035DA27C7
MIRHTEVNGIPTVLTPMSGPLQAGLMFRVGRADETLATAGITHLTEHLALHRQGLTDFHFNGATSATETHFVVQGTATEVVSYLNGVCASLRDLPLDRLEIEKEILRTEAAGRGGNSPLPLWRHGAQGYGLLSYPEHGLHRVGPDDVREWAARWFTRQNAVLWLTSDHLPDGLDLQLPDGVRHPAPAATSALPTSPAYFHGGENHVLLHSVVRRSPAAMLYADVLGRALFRQLRQEDGLSYQAAAEYSSRDAEFAVVTAVADALPAKREAVLGGFVDVLAGLRVGRIDRAELDSVRDQALGRLEEPDAAARRLPGTARDLLLGRTPLGVAELRSQLAAVTAADLGRVAQEAAASALLMTPRGTGADWAGFTAAPTSSDTAVAGKRWRSAPHEGHALVVGADGVSIVGPHGQATVRYEECAAMLTHPDGARYLTGFDGMSVDIEPTLYRLPARVVAQVDAAVPQAVVVPLPARPQEHIPKPPAKPVAPPTPRFNRISAWKARISLWVLSHPRSAAALGLLLILGTLTVVGNDQNPSAAAVIAMVVPAVVISLRQMLRRRR